jgi:4-amino-4-deoxy-L-arabinose transferase-like glycosyltransferase
VAEIPGARRGKERWLEALLLCAVFALACWLRMLSAAQTVVEMPFRNDAREYVSYAYNTAHWQVYSREPNWLRGIDAAPAPDALRPPAYPYFLRLFLDGRPDDAFVRRVVIAQSFLGMLTVLIGYGVARRLLGWRAALAVALLLALCPQLVVYQSYRLSETLFTLWVGVLVWMLTVYAFAQGRAPRLTAAAMAGALLGASILTRPTLSYLPWALLGLALAVPAWRAHRGAAACALLACLCVTSPWSLRNLQVMGRASDPHLAIATLQGGSYPDFMYDGDPQSYDHPIDVDPRTPQISASMGSVLSEIARKFRSDPITYLRWYLIGKPVALLGWNEVAGWGWVFVYSVLASPFMTHPTVMALSAIMAGMHWPLVLCGLVGMLAVWRPRFAAARGAPATLGLRLISLIYAFVIAVHVAGTPLPRYAVPFRLLSYLLAVVFLAEAATALRQRVRAARAATSAPALRQD